MKFGLVSYNDPCRLPTVTNSFGMGLDSVILVVKILERCSLICPLGAHLLKTHLSGWQSPICTQDINAVLIDA